MGAVIKPIFSRCFVKAIVLSLGTVAVVPKLVAQATPVEQGPAQTVPKEHPHGSLGEELTGMVGREVHIFFVHGIGSDGPNAHDSLALRKSICAYLKDCVSPTGEQEGNYDYADQGEFAPDAPVPTLQYMGKPVWGTAEEWHAAAPFAVHYLLKRSGGVPVYVDELNWWPLVFALKCRKIVDPDTRLSGPSVDRIKACATREADSAVPGRFVGYDWIPAADAEQLLARQNRGALVNRSIKHSLSDWQFPDAVMALGPMHKLLVDGVRQLIMKSMTEPGDGAATATEANPLAPAPNQEFVIVTQSLGSYLIFSALEIDPAATQTPLMMQSAGAFSQVLRQTSLVYFFANQLPLLELANLEESPSDRFVSRLEVWGKLHCDYEQLEYPGAPCRLPRIIALNDPSDLLTWRLPKLDTVEVQNYRVQNARHWFGLIENPMKAHIDYSSNKRAIQELLHPTTRDLEK
jgi:hypothetical protein